jgi:hypothetical protein
VAAVRALRRRLAGTLVVTGIVASLAVPAANADLIGGLIGVACTSGPIGQPFARWGDGTSYELAPNGGFEAGATGWSLSGAARVVSGNEPFHLNSAGDSHALALPDGSSATSGPVCIGGLTKATIRFVATNSGASTSRLHVEVLYRGLTGLLGVLDGGYVTAGTWAPSPQLLALQTPLLGTSAVQLRFTPIGSGGGWRIDDVYTDPWGCR